MANPDHLAILHQGVDAWNRWRRSNPDILINLRRANLTDMDLRYANLVEADLERANLTGTKVCYANLAQADLASADLSHADLSSTHLTDARLTHAQLASTLLISADLAGARMAHANLSYANLRNADLTHAHLAYADLTHADLKGATVRQVILDGTYLADRDLRRIDLTGASLVSADLTSVALNGATLRSTNLRAANLSAANLDGADCTGADFTDTKLTHATLRGANLTETDLTRADLTGAQLLQAILVRTRLTQASLTGCEIHGIAAWDLNLIDAIQKDLIITPVGSPVITVDNLEVAQFIYLLLNNAKIRDVINTITSKVVLILGRFSDNRKPILDAIREVLRQHNYLPVMFDFDPPHARNLTETVTTLASLARFVIADITEPRSIPQELMAIIPHQPSVPVAPIISFRDREWGMFADFKDYPWVLPVVYYHDLNELLASLEDKVIGPAEEKARMIEDYRRPSS